MWQHGGWPLGDSQIITWIDSHGLLLLGVYIIFSGAVNNLEAPTATSGAFYRWFFKYANYLASSWARARGAQIERSPNWNDAVVKAINGAKCDNCGAKIDTAKLLQQGASNGKTQGP